MKDYDKNKESSYLQYQDVNNLCGWAMSQKLPLNNSEWTKETSQFDEDFIKKYNEESDKGYFLVINVQYIEKLHEIHNDLPRFYHKEWRMKKSNSWQQIYLIKLNILYT